MFWEQFEDFVILDDNHRQHEDPEWKQLAAQARLWKLTPLDE